MGRLDKAEQFLTEALTGLQRIRKEGHPEILNTLSFLAAVREEQGRLPEAEALCVQILETRRTHGHGAADVAGSLTQLGRIRLKQNMAIEADAPLRESIALWGKVTEERVGAVLHSEFARRLPARAAEICRSRATPRRRL